MYRLGLEAILGLTRLGDTLKIAPCIPGNWPGFQLTYRFGRTPYLIRVENPDGVNCGVRQIMLNGVSLPDKRIPLTDDGRQQVVRVLMGSALPPRGRKSEKNDRDDFLSRGVK
jgi:cellobiose phosphorylase